MLLIKRISTHNFKQVILRTFSSTLQASSELIKRELYLDNQVVRLVLNNQKKRNTLSLEMMNILHKELLEIDDIQKVRAIILAAEGSVFSSGHDLKELVIFVILRFFLYLDGIQANKS